MVRKSWALAVGLVGVVTISGCSSRSNAYSDAGAPPGDATPLPDAPATAVDPDLPLEPVIPAVCAGATLDAPHAVRATGGAVTDGLPVYDLAALDTAAIQASIDACAASLAAGQKGSVRLQVNAADPTKVAFVSGPVFLKAGVSLWIDRGVTLFAAQDPRLYDVDPGTCGTDANNNSGGCLSLINAKGGSATALLLDAGVVGDGVIDGLGGEPMVGGFNGNPNGTWWDVAQHALAAGVSHSNPRLIDVLLADRFTIYRVTLHNSPKFHVGLESDNYLVWGVTVQTPSRPVNRVGRPLTARYARNTDGIDPSDSWNGTIAYSRISVGDDQIAIKCGKYHLNSVANADQPSCRNLVVAHTQFGTGHGMSIGSETNGGPKGDDAHVRIGMQGIVDPATQAVQTWGLHVYDLTIDGSVGTGSAAVLDINGIRIKSDVSRGGLVKDVLYEDVCLRNLPNPIVLNPHYDPTKTGALDPTYQNIVLRNIHGVASSGGSAPHATPVVSLLGLDPGHRTVATLDNVVIDGIDPHGGVLAQFADLTLGPGPVNFVPDDPTVGVTRRAEQAAPPVACGDRFTTQFPDYGTDVSLDNNASLARLDVAVNGAAVGLAPAFTSGVTAYTVTAPAQIGGVTIAPTASAPNIQSITVAQDGGAPVAVASGSAATLAVPPPGATTQITVQIVAQDGTTGMTYTVRLTRSDAGHDAALDALTDSAGALAFVPGSVATAYTYQVPIGGAAGYTVTPTAHDPTATIRVNGAAVVSGTASAPIDLSSGRATVTVVVTAEDGVTAITYTLDITVDETRIAVTGIAFSRSSLRLDTSASSTGALPVTFMPPGATDRQLTWRTGDPAVATVDATGTVHAVAPGQAVIAATSHDGGFTASFTVHVFSPWFSEDFEAGSSRWDLLTVPGPVGGSFGVVADETSVLQYTAGTAGGVVALVQDAAFTGVPAGDYYVEARIKPMTNSTTANKQIYLVARYQDPSNWYGAGLNVQSSTTSTSVDIAKMSAGSLARPGQTKRSIAIGAWYTVRFELVGPSLSVYLDGALLKTVTDLTAPVFTAGKIGLFTSNKSFEIDDIRVGDPSDRPVQLTIDQPASWTAEAGTPPLTVAVTAQQPSYATGGYLPDTFSVTSSDPTVVSAVATGATVALTPVAAGSATITFTSGAQPSLTRTISATISPAFVQPTTVYALAGRAAPAAGSLANQIDTRLAITFDRPPALGTTGSVRIFRKADDALIDVIKPVGETDAIGFPGQDQLRVVNVEGLITIAGNTATIVPHHARLAYGTEYYVAIADGVLTGTALAGTPFRGIGRLGDWSFTTRAAPATSLTSLTVDDDGPAEFATVQGALDYVMKNAAAATPVTIQIRNGTYQELLFLRGKHNVTLVGESRDGVILQYRNYETLNSGSGASQAAGAGTPGGGRAVFLVEASDLLTLDTLTLKNTMLRSVAQSSQAETIYFSNDGGRLIAKNANFLSEQDTLQLKGYSWFYRSLIAGNVDFIWGANRASLFEDCEIRTVGDTAGTTAGGYVVQARSVSAADKGFVFLNSRLTHGPGPGPLAADVATGADAATYLARSPGLGTSDDNVAFVHCAMDAHIVPVGWADNVAGQPAPNPAVATAASGWREYGSADLAGAPLDLTRRFGGYLLTPGEVTSGFADRAAIFAAFGGGAGWNPQP